MYQSILRPTKRRRFIPLAIVAILIVAGALAFDRLEFAVRYALFTVRAERAASIEPSGAQHATSWRFRFRGEAIVVRVPYSDGEVEAAQAVPTRAVFASPSRERRVLIETLVRTQAASGLVARLDGVLSEEADRRALDDNARLELAVRAVQSLPYGTPKHEFGLPAETLERGDGVCTDKTILLASLLSRNGYDVVIWSFSDQRHVAMGVRSSGSGFRDTGYTFIETTRPQLIGQASDSYFAQGPTLDPPLQVRIAGPNRYGAGWESERIALLLQDAEHQSRRLQPYVYASLGRGGEDGVRRLADRQRQISRTAEFIRRNSDDRPFVFARLCEHGWLIESPPSEGG